MKYFRFAIAEYTNIRKYTNFLSNLILLLHTRKSWISNFEDCQVIFQQIIRYHLKVNINNLELTNSPFDRFLNLNPHNAKTLLLYDYFIINFLFHSYHKYLIT